MAKEDTRTEPLLTVRQVADRLQVPRQRAYELVGRRRIPGVVRLGRQIRIDPTALEEWIESGGSEADQ